jgi:hypothetical protein
MTTKVSINIVTAANFSIENQPLSYSGFSFAIP